MRDSVSPTAVTAISALSTGRHAQHRVKPPLLYRRPAPSLRTATRTALSGPVTGGMPSTT